MNALGRAAAIALVLIAPARAFAQQDAHRIEVFGGAGLFGGAALGSADANLRANQTTPRPYRLFTTENTLARTPTLHVAAGYTLSKRIAVEGGLTFSRPELRTSIGADAEGAAPVTVAERIDQYFFDGNVVVLIDELRVGDRLLPFAEGGAGYLRQLHRGLTLTEQGQVYHVGGGAKYWFVPVRQGFVRAAGVRTDVRLYLLARGVSFDDRPRPHAAISGSVFVTF